MVLGLAPRENPYLTSHQSRAGYMGKPYGLTRTIRSANNPHIATFALGLLPSIPPLQALRHDPNVLDTSPILMTSARARSALDVGGRSGTACLLTVLCNVNFPGLPELETVAERSDTGI